MTVFVYLFLNNSDKNEKSTTISIEKSNEDDTLESVKKTIQSYYGYLEKKNYEVAVSWMSDRQILAQNTTRDELAKRLRDADSQSKVERMNFTVKQIERLEEDVYEGSVSFTFKLGENIKEKVERFLVVKEKGYWKLDFVGLVQEVELPLRETSFSGGRIQIHSIKWQEYKFGEHHLLINITNLSSDALRIGLYQDAAIIVNADEAIQASINPVMIPPAKTVVIKAEIPNSVSYNINSITIGDLYWTGMDGIVHSPPISINVNIKQ